MTTDKLKELLQNIYTDCTVFFHAWTYSEIFGYSGLFTLNETCEDPKMGVLTISKCIIYEGDSKEINSYKTISTPNTVLDQKFKINQTIDKILKLELL